MYCKRPYRRMRTRAATAPRQSAPQILVHAPLPSGLVSQLACPLNDMGDVERLLAHLYCAKARGYY